MAANRGAIDHVLPVIGKEASDLEWQATLGFDPEATIDYSQGCEKSPALLDLLRTFTAATMIENGDFPGERGNSPHPFNEQC